jgi:hypothetical protein
MSLVSHVGKSSPVLAYETPALREASEFLARFAFICCTFPTGIGIAILAGYATHRADGIALLGFLCLYIGGGVTFMGILMSVISLATCRGTSNEREVRRWSLLALILGLLSIPIAIGCIVVGKRLLPPSFW